MKFGSLWLAAVWLITVGPGIHAAAAQTGTGVVPAEAGNSSVEAANDSPPTDASIEELLAVTNAHQLVDGLKVQVDAMVRAAMQQAEKGKTITPEARAVLDRMQAKMRAVAEETLNWETMQGIYIRTYKASFTQGELDSMLALYKSTAGQALIKKMPLVMHNVLVEMQGVTATMQQKIQQIQRETVNELNALPAGKAVNSKT